MPQTVAVLLKGYPRLSETFIAQELLALERAGLDLRLVSLRHPTDRAVHPVHREIQAPVAYLPEYLWREPARVFAGWRRARGLSGYQRALKAFLADLRRDLTPNRIRRFGQACVLAAEIPRDVDRLYAHFLHTPASVARYTALMTGLPWSVSAHARDIWTTPDWEKREKLAELDWLVTCTKLGYEHLRDLSADPEKVRLAYHGLDFERFPAPPARPSRDGSDARDPVRILSVGRAVPKKGYEDLLRALARLPEDTAWRFTHVGGGALSRKLKHLAGELGLADRIDWLGAQPHERVLQAYRDGDLFMLASLVAGDGDRDGLPNVLMEAQSQGLACLSTRVSAIPELLIEGETGCMVPPSAPAELAKGLTRLIKDPALRQRLGAAGNARVRADFSMQAGMGVVFGCFGLNRDGLRPAVPLSDRVEEGDTEESGASSGQASSGRAAAG